LIWLHECISPHITDGNKVVMIGLHCCGDLTPSMLRIFSQSNLVKGLIGVGCCYNHITYKQEDGILTILFYY